MRYWDTSALVPLLVQEPGSDLVRGWLEDDPYIVTWGLSRLELVGAIERRARQNAIGPTDRRSILGRADRFAKTWDEVTAMTQVANRGVQLLARHALRAADAAQLAAALLLAEGDPSSVEFVCLDRTLADAAEREGFPILSWDPR